MNKFKSLLIFLLLLPRASNSCATNNFYTSCLEYNQGSTNIYYNEGSKSGSHHFTSSLNSFFGNSCLISMHFVAKDFEDADYYGSKWRSKELNLFDFTYNPLAYGKCQIGFNYTNLLTQTNNQIKIYFVKLVRKLISSGRTHVNRELCMRRNNFIVNTSKQALDHSRSKSFN